MADLESRKTIGVIIECAKLTPEIFQQAIDDMLKNMTEKKSKGKTTLKKLMQNGRVDSIEVTDSNIGSFATTARKYNLNYAVKRIQDENGKKQYLVCFNGKDIDTMQKAFRNRQCSTKQRLPLSRFKVRKKKLWKCFVKQWDNGTDRSLTKKNVSQKSFLCK